MRVFAKGHFDAFIFFASITSTTFFFLRSSFIKPSAYSGNVSKPTPAPKSPSKIFAGSEARHAANARRTKALYPKKAASANHVKVALKGLVNRDVGPQVKVNHSIFVIFQGNFSGISVIFKRNFTHSKPKKRTALRELFRVTKSGGKVIVPTYINMSKGTGKVAVKFIEKLGANFKRQFDLESYKKFFADLGVTGVEYFVVEGRMPCAVAVMGK